MIWPDFIPMDHHNYVVETAKMLRKINKAALQDLEDYIIVQGMEATLEEVRENRRKAVADG
jgi:hypothetical protein